jgi:type III secretion protein T
VEGIDPASGAPLFSLLPWLDQMLLVGVSSARFGFAFVFVPIFSKEVMPGTVRNSIIITFGLVALAMRPDFAPAQLSAGAWAAMLLKEVAAGTIIGLFFGTIMWSMTAAGEIIDTKVGATIAQVIDPMTGASTSLNGILFGRFAQIIFVVMGGISLLVGTVIQSYLIWPLGPGGINVQAASVLFFENEFGRFFSLAFVFAVPILTVLYIIDLGMGFLNRFAQQFNVFSLSMPIKSVAATLLIIIILPMLANAIIVDMRSRNAVASGVLSRVGQPLSVHAEPPKAEPPKAAPLNTIPSNRESAKP